MGVRGAAFLGQMSRCVVFRRLFVGKALGGECHYFAFCLHLSDTLLTRFVSENGSVCYS